MCGGAPGIKNAVNAGMRLQRPEAKVFHPKSSFNAIPAPDETWQ